MAWSSLVTTAVILACWRLQADGLITVTSGRSIFPDGKRLVMTTTGIYRSSNKKISQLPLYTVLHQPVVHGERVLAKRQPVVHGERVLAKRQPVVQGERVLAKRQPVVHGERALRKRQPVVHGERTLMKRQAVDPVLQDLSNLVAQAEAEAVDASSMAGQPGRGWSDWSPWSACSVTCGTVGEKTRQRQCRNDPLTGVTCPGANTESNTCTPATLSCPETTSWGAWQDWGTCSVSCGDGLRARERSCVVSDPNLSCPGDSAQTEPCNLQSCNLKESWTKWSAWSKCSVTCGSGHMSRERMCQDDATGVEAYQCPGKKHSKEICDQPICSSGVRVKTVHAVEGHSAMLKCLYDKMSAPVSIYWLTPDSLKITHQSEHPLYEAIGDTLNIRHASSDMVGLYRCVVEDAYGKILMGEAPVDVLDCTSRPCRNSGMCQEIQAVDHFNTRFTTYRCLCGLGYNGVTCEGGLGPGYIAALVMCVILALVTCSGICMIYRVRKAETKPSKLIAPKESKLVVVTSRDALAVSCDESSSEATLSDSPMRQLDFDGDINAPPHLKGSRGIGNIFPKWGWNNNNSLCRVFPGQVPLPQNSRSTYRYTLANTSDVSESCAETTPLPTERSGCTNNANKNYNKDNTSGSTSVTTTSSGSSITSSSDAATTDKSSAKNVSFDSDESTSSSSSESTRSSSEGSSESHEGRTRRHPRAKRRNTAYYCPSTSSLETRLKPLPAYRPSTIRTQSAGFPTLSQYPPPHPQSNSSNCYGNYNQSCHIVTQETPKRPLTPYQRAFSRPKKQTDISKHFIQNNLVPPPVTSEVAGTSREVQGRALAEMVSYSAKMSPGLDPAPILHLSPVDSSGVQKVCSPPECIGLSSLDRNQSCTLANDQELDTKVDPIDPMDVRSDPLQDNLDMGFSQTADLISEPNFSNLFQKLRVQLHKEREKAAAKMNCLTSIVNESSRRQGGDGRVTPPQSSNLPAYGDSWTHATSSPIDPSSHSAPPPKINLSMVLSDQTSVSCQSSSDHFSVICRTSPDTPRETSSSRTNCLVPSPVPPAQPSPESGELRRGYSSHPHPGGRNDCGGGGQAMPAVLV